MNNTEPTAAQLADALCRDFARANNSESCLYCGNHQMLREDRHGESICVDLQKCIGRRS